MTIDHGCVPKCAICLAGAPSLCQTPKTVSGAASDLVFCHGEIADAKADMARAERRIAFFQREIARIEALIEKASK